MRVFRKNGSSTGEYPHEGTRSPRPRRHHRVLGRFGGGSEAPTRHAPLTDQPDRNQGPSHVVRQPPTRGWGVHCGLTGARALADHGVVRGPLHSQEVWAMRERQGHGLRPQGRILHDFGGFPAEVREPVRHVVQLGYPGRSPGPHPLPRELCQGRAGRKHHDKRPGCVPVQGHVGGRGLRLVGR